MSKKPTMRQFERSKFDRDSPKSKEGSKADKARDAKQFQAFKKSKK